MAFQPEYAQTFRLRSRRIERLRIVRKFEIPGYFKSEIIGGIKNLRNEHDKRKSDFSPTILDYGKVRFYLARHFGFCFGVQNAIEIAYKALNENPGKRIFLLSEMIHNPDVNNDLREQGIFFLQDTLGNQLISWDEVTNDDIIIIPAFGTTLETLEILKRKEIEYQTYNTTCPFVERVWNRSEIIGRKGFTIIIHGKHNHEETRATFSHVKKNSHALIVRDLSEAGILADFIGGKISETELLEYFSGKVTEGFVPAKHLVKIGVINQTTMLAEETQAIADLLKNALEKKYGKENLKSHFADNRDTLCYATNDNQTATKKLLETDADFAVVVGGYNSSNTTHLYELLAGKFPAYFIRNNNELLNANKIRHFDLSKKEVVVSANFIPEKEPVKIAITSGASCPDSEVEAVIKKLVSFVFGEGKNQEPEISFL